jgi:hypothetical protein
MKKNALLVQERLKLPIELNNTNSILELTKGSVQSQMT